MDSNSIKSPLTIMSDALVGSEYTELLCNGISKAGIEVHLIVPENKRLRGESLVQIHRWLPSKDPNESKLFKIWHYFNYIIRLIKLSFNNRSCVVHYQFFRFPFEVIVLCILKLLRRKIIFTAHNIYSHERERYDSIIRKIIYHISTAVIVHSHFIKKELLSLFKIPEQKVHVIPHGNYDSYLPEKLISKMTARNTLNLTESDNVILFFGAIKPYKGLDLLLDAFELTSKNNPNLKLIIAGSAGNYDIKKHYLDKVNQITSNKNILSFIKFIDSDDVALYFSASDLIALPYKSIYHSGVAHLAFSFGRPLIVTRVGDFEEMLENGTCGFVVDGFDATQLSNGIKEAFSDISRLEKMSQNMLKINKTKYGWDEIGMKTTQLYQSLCHGNNCE